jgi:phosphoglucosamine mutase
MSFKYFNEDGIIHGKTNNGIMNPIMVTKIAYAIGAVFGGQKSDERHSALICKDTRLSNYSFEGTLQGGLTAVGMDVLLSGPLPTPGAAWLTDSMRADVGIVLTASYHPYHDNGIKIFGPDGSKPTEQQKLEIERLIDLESHQKLLAAPERGGKAWRIPDAQGQYVAHVKSMLLEHVRFGGMRVVLDCAHGASYEVAPRIIKELGAEVFTIGVNPTGHNINEECGSSHPGALKSEVKKYRADLGIALDGDGDHVIMVDEHGHTIDGSQMLSIVSRSDNKEVQLAKPTDDGLVTALQVMSVVQVRKLKASEVFHCE